MRHERDLQTENQRERRGERESEREGQRETQRETEREPERTSPERVPSKKGGLPNLDQTGSRPDCSEGVSTPKDRPSPER